MDDELREAIESGLPPFNGKTYFVNENIPTSDIRGVLKGVVQLLRPKFENATIFVNSDWYERDDYPGCAGPIDWERIEINVSKTKNLNKWLASSSNYRVKVSIYSTNGEFLIRFGKPDDDFKSGNFDITVVDELSQEIEAVLQEKGVNFTVGDPRIYFNDVKSDESWV